MVDFVKEDYEKTRNLVLDGKYKEALQDYAFSKSIDSFNALFNVAGYLYNGVNKDSFIEFRTVVVNFLPKRRDELNLDELIQMLESLSCD